MTRTILPVTVIIPTYNREHLLEKTLRCVERQEHFRVAQTIVVDDHSSDGSADLAQRLGYRVVRLEENGGAAAARNVGIELADTEWLCFLDSDDRWEPNLLATLWPHTDSHVLVSGSAYLCADDEIVSLMGPELPGQTLLGPLDIIDPPNSVMTSTTLVRRDVVDRVGGFNTRWRYSEDFDLWLRVLEHGTGFCDATPTMRYGRGGSSKSEHQGGVDDARVRILYSFAGRPWFRRTSAEHLVGIIYWEAVRSALRARQPLKAALQARRIARNRHRIQGVVLGVRRRRRLRRRLRSLAPNRVGC